MRAIFDTVIKYVPVREDNTEAPLQLQICSLDYSSYVGKSVSAVCTAVFSKPVRTL